jgi:tRNA-binding EMAP/Myf-like protein
VKIALSWLREFVDLPESTEELREILDDLGLVVEGIEHVGEGLDDVVVARIDEIRAIEGADRVRLVVVDANDGPLEIVCGAMNISVGDHVPLAPIGAVLPGNFEIARRTMRGVTSNGMLCSATELRLGDDHSGLMLLDNLIDPVVGMGLLEALDITPDVVFDITVEGNRPDAWSVMGVARDLATRLGRTVTQPPRRAQQLEGFVDFVRERRHRRPRSVRATHGLGAASGEGRSLAGVGRGATPERRTATDLQRRRRVEPRDARTRPTHPPLRCGARGEADAAGAPGAFRRDHSRRSTACSVRWHKMAAASATPARTA